MMSRSSFKTEYQALNVVSEDEDQDSPPSNNVVQILPDNFHARRWNHIEDLDDFFTRVYQYHQRSGFLCMVLQDVFQLVQFMFVVLFSTFLLTCVDYHVLFHDGNNTLTHKVTIADTVLSLQQCSARFHPVIVVGLIVSSFVWLFRFCKIMYNILKYWEIRSFFLYALNIHQAELVSMTWHELQRKLLQAQKDLQMCIHKAELSELDIYHRILRFKNYMIAMVNKSVLSVKFQIPFFGEYIFLTSGFKYNLEMILFWGPFSPFENSWHLKPDYRNACKKKELADLLSRHILWVAVANFVFSPLIFLWQILYSFFRYAEMIKREPGALGSRRWSLYSRLYLRHFNELDHEFSARLNRAYSVADKYVNIFTSPLLSIFAKHLAFLAGSVLAVLIILTVIDEDVLAVEHVLGLMTVLGIITTVCRVLIPDEHLVSCPELLMRAILAHIHYIPDSWKGNAHTYKVRNEFTQLFQYKVTFLIEELISPIVTPFILCFRLRHKSNEIIDFFRNFTVDVTGVGDVCSFAQMDIQKHGHPQWRPVAEAEEEIHPSHPAESGKTELSLMHFTLTNPEWRPPQTESTFISALKAQAQRDMTNVSVLPADNPLLTSSQSMSLLGPGYNSFVLSAVHHCSAQHLPPTVFSVVQQPPPDVESQSVMSSPTYLRGSVRNMEYPQSSNVLQSINFVGRSAGVLKSPSFDIHQHGMYDEGTLEMLSAEMSFSALYMHDIHNLLRTRGNCGNFSEDERARQLWQTRIIASPSIRMPNIQEGIEEEDNTRSRESDCLLRVESTQNQNI
jgi:autophagy-related protein 9